MKLSRRLQDERRFVETLCGHDSICARCHTNLQGYADNCVAELSEECPGFWKIEDLKREFASQALSTKEPENAE